MINFQTMLYYYFILIVVFLFCAFKTKFQKTQKMLAVNLVFHVLLFYFDKKRFLQFQLIVLVNYLFVYYYQKELEVKKAKHNASMATAITLNIIYFIVVKYTYWAVLSRLGIAAFIGFSFFMFRLLSLYIDLKRNVIKEKINFSDYYNYLTFFPVFLSGPLNRFNKFQEDLTSINYNTALQQFNHTYRIVWGTFKKMVLADFLYDFSIDSINISDLSHIPSYKILISMYIYALVIYLDFSGYSDVAIGVCGLFGINIPENFNNPFKSKNIQEFWNRWHISFMHWLRDYIYYPIQMFILRNKLTKNALLASVVGYMITFLVAGLWHGNQVQYLYYGLYHGICFSIYLAWKMVIQKTLSQEQKSAYYESKFIALASVLITFHYFIFGLIFYTGKYVYFFKS